MKRAALALAAGLTLSGCATTGINMTQEVVTREQVVQACELTMLLYAGWEAAGNPGSKDPAQLRKVRAAYAAIEGFCITAPTTPLGGMTAGIAALRTFREQLAAAKAGR